MTPLDSNMLPVLTFSSKPSLVSQTRCPCPVTLSNLCYPLPNDSGRKSEVCPCESYIVFSANRLSTVKFKNSKTQTGPCEVKGVGVGILYIQGCCGVFMHVCGQNGYEKPKASNLGVLFDHDWNVEAHFKYHSNRFLVFQKSCISKAISAKGRYWWTDADFHH